MAEIHARDTKEGSEARARNPCTAGRAAYLDLVSASAAKVFLWLLARPGEKSLQTSSDVAKEIGLSRNTVDRARRELEDLAWVSVSWDERRAGHFPRWRAELKPIPAALQKKAADLYERAAEVSLQRAESRLARIETTRASEPAGPDLSGSQPTVPRSSPTLSDQELQRDRILQAGEGEGKPTGSISATGRGHSRSSTCDKAFLNAISSQDSRPEAPSEDDGRDDGDARTSACRAGGYERLGTRAMG